MQHAQFLQLPQIMPLGKYLSIRQLDELQVVVVDHPLFSASVAMQGAHLLSWSNKQNEPSVFWLSKKALFKKGVAIRGGIPICWPWFANRGGSPSHGFVRTMQWSVKNYEEKEDSLCLSFKLSHTPETLALWPHEFTLLMHFTFTAQSCTAQLEAQGSFESSGALHSYFTVGDINQVQVQGQGTVYEAFGQAGKLDSENLSFSRETDMIFSNPQSLNRVLDAALQREIMIEHQHNSNVVVWNPWVERTGQLKDMEPDGYKTMVCVETLALDQPLQSSPDNAAHLSVKISTKPLNDK